tara:strand:- start:26973 stop:27398 length:426 start_codon:yes stop_codon:yes gene_type:complete
MSRENIDNIISYILIKKLVTPIIKTKAYSLGLVNNAGRVVKSPDTENERQALTVLDRLIFKLKRLLGSKLINLNSFLYLSTLSNDFYNKLIVRGSVNQRAEILRIKKDIQKLAEDNGSDVQGVLETLLVEEIQTKGDSDVL